MYAVIRTGGKQYKVAAGDVIEVERLKIKGDDPTLSLTPLFVVDDNGNAISGADKLAGYKVGVKVVGDTKGDKVTVFKYRNKSGYASKTGHRQQYSMIEITSIGSEKPKKAEKPEPAKSEAADSDTVDN
jgi:large subunit ribosomal protein L21